MIETFEFLCALIESKCPWVRHIDKFNDQITMMANGQEIEMDYPAVLIQFGPITWETRSPNLQFGPCTIQFYIADVTTADSYQGSSSKEIALEQMRLYRKLHKVLQGAASDYCSALDRIAQEEDEVYGEMNSMILSYSTILVEETDADTTTQEVTIGLGVQGEMDPEMDGVDARPQPPAPDYLIN